MKKLERIQKQALGYMYVYNNYSSSYEELLNKANRPTLYVQRIRSVLNIVYKSNETRADICTGSICDQ